MPSPRLEAAANSSRSEESVRAAWRERFIQRQLAGLAELGLSKDALAREEALLRGGFAAGKAFAGLPDRAPDGLV
jgi:hypothetical protein